MNFVFPILVLYNINMNGCTRLAFFISLSWRADESYLGRNSRNFLKSMKLIILLSFSGKFEMHLSRNFCSWCNDQQQSVSVYVLSKFVLLWSLLTQCGRSVMISQKNFRNPLKMPTWKNRLSLVKFNGKKMRKFCFCKSIGDCLGTLSSLRKYHISDIPLFRNIPQ